MNELEASRRMFLDSISGLSPAQWMFKPGPELWSIAEVGEHLLLAEESLFDEVANQIMRTPAAPAEPAAAGRDGQVLRSTLDRANKATAPDYLAPSGTWSLEALVAEFQKLRDRAIAYVRSAGDKLRMHSLSHPDFGSVDAYQCFLALAGHTRRHVEQIREIRANSEFPER